MKGEAAEGGSAVTEKLSGCVEQEMVLLNNLSSKKRPLQITREEWSSMNISADRVVPSLESFRNGNALSVIVVGEEPVTTA